MDRSAATDGLAPLLARAGLEPGTLSSAVEGMRCELWLREGEPVVLVLVEGDAGDRMLLHRLAWSAGCPIALVLLEGGIGWVETASSPADGLRPPIRGVNPETLPACLARLVPSPVPGVVETLVELMEAWRARTLRRALAERADWSEEELSLAVEAPLVDLLLDGGGTGPAYARMQAELDRAGVILPLVPPGLLALAWDRHLCRSIRLRGADAGVVGGAESGPGPDRTVLRRFAQWAGEGPEGLRRVLFPACGAGRLLLLMAEWAAAHNIQIHALDPDPRAVLFASRLLDRDLGARVSWIVRAANPLVGIDLFDDPLARLIPPDSRARLRAMDWETVFSGVRQFDRVVIGDPVLSMTRRQEVRRYLEEHYATAGAGTDPALLLVEAGARHLTVTGRVFALYAATALRAGRAAPLRRWLAPRTEASVASSDPGYIAVRAASVPVEGPIGSGSLTRDPPVLRAHPRSALNIDGWTIHDPATAALRRRLEAESAPLGEILLGGIGLPPPVALDTAYLIGADDRRRLLRADRRAARVLRPVIGPEDLVPYGTVSGASRFLITGPLPKGARRVARELGVAPSAPSRLVLPPIGPRLLFVEGTRTPAFLCDRDGRAVLTPGIGELRPASLFLLGLLHSGPIAALLADRCPGGLTARCLLRLPVRLPDPYDPREQALRDRITGLVRERLAGNGSTGPNMVRRQELESAIDDAVRELYFPSPDREPAFSAS